jgi:hypothetical protein
MGSIYSTFHSSPMPSSARVPLAQGVGEGFAFTSFHAKVCCPTYQSWQGQAGGNGDTSTGRGNLVPDEGVDLLCLDVVRAGVGIQAQEGETPVPDEGVDLLCLYVVRAGVGIQGQEGETPVPDEGVDLPCLDVVRAGVGIQAQEGETPVPDEGVDLLCLDVVQPADGIFDLLLGGPHVHNEHLASSRYSLIVHG